MYERTYRERVLKKAQEAVPKKRRLISLREYRAHILWITLGVVIVVGGVFLARAPQLQIKNVEVVGTHVADPNDVSAFVMNELQGRILFVIPKTSIVLVQRNRLERAVKLLFPRFETVSITRKNLSTLSVSVTEYGGVYLWCTSDTDCSFMDKNGIVFADAPYFSGTAYPKIFIGGEAQLPFTPILKSQIDLVSTLIDRLKVIGIVPAEFHFVTEHQLDIVFMHNNHESKIIIDPTLPINDSLDALFTGLRTQPLSTKYHDETTLLEYIDLRFAHKVVYRFQ